VRKTSVIPAALLAAGFVFGASATAEAASAHHKRVVSSSSSTVSSRTQAHKKKTTSTHRTAKKSPKKAQHRIHQTPEGAVVLDRIAVETVEFYGPFLPVEAFDYPQPPCTEFDAVVEAHVHETDEETPEPADVAESVPAEAPANALTRIARTLGALLRPKSAQSTVRPEDVDLSDLLSAGVQIPVEGVDASGLKDSFLNSRGRHQQHLAIDIGAPKGTPVLAAADGQIVALRREKRGGISLYQKDASGKYLLFYCHLTKYAKGIKPGETVARGDVIAYVGRTGHVIGGPHLHFSITRLPEDDDNFKAGVAINPYLLFLAAVP
jgi:murein DD-endopeptidase MepM/ murein hydrolase activator NlpD